MGSYVKRMFVGRCSPDTLFELNDPDGFSEAAFEACVVKGLACAFPAYQCVIFTGSFSHEGKTFKPDLALLALDGSHWFIIEVELTSHSLHQHVLPQVCAFKYGEPQQDGAFALSAALGIPVSQAHTLLQRIPYGVAVVSNRENAEWAIALRAHGIQMLTVSSYSCPKGLEAVEVNGSLEVVRDSLGFGLYMASLRSLRFSVALRVPNDRVQIRDAHGGLSWWLVHRDSEATWLTKELGTPDIEDRRHVQLVATRDGGLSLR